MSQRLELHNTEVTVDLEPNAVTQNFNNTINTEPTLKAKKTDYNEKPVTLYGKEQKPKASVKAYLILILFLIYTFGAGFAFVTFSPILPQAEAYYDKDETSVVNLAMIFMYIFIVFSFPCSYFADKHFRYAMIFGIVLQAAGGCFRYFGHRNYGMSLAGTILLAISTNFTLSTPAYIGHIWFPSHLSTFVIACCTFGNFAGTGVGFLIPTLFVNYEQTPEESFDGIDKLLLVQLIMFLAPLIPSFFVFEDSPQELSHHDGHAVNTSDDRKTNYWCAVRNTMKNWRLQLSAAAFGMGFGLTLTVQSVMVTLLPANYPIIKVGITGLIFVGVGILFGIFGQLSLNFKSVQGNYDRVIRMFFMASQVVLICIAVWMRDADNDALIFAFNAIGGFGLIAFLPFATESLIENAYPAPENIPANWLFWWGQLWGVVGTYLTTMASQEFRLWVLVIMIGPPTLWILFGHKTLYAKKKMLSENAKLMERKGQHQRHHHHIPVPDAANAPEIPEVSVSAPKHHRLESNAFNAPISVELQKTSDYQVHNVQISSNVIPAPPKISSDHPQ